MLPCQSISSCGGDLQEAEACANAGSKSVFARWMLAECSTVSQPGGASAIVSKTQTHKPQKSQLHHLAHTLVSAIFFFLSRINFSIYFCIIHQPLYFALVIHPWVNGWGYFPDICVGLPVPHSKHCFGGQYVGETRRQKAEQGKADSQAPDRSLV